jgi:hypothetical protein
VARRGGLEDDRLRAPVLGLVRACRSPSGRRRGPRQRAREPRPGRPAQGDSRGPHDPPGTPEVDDAALVDRLDDPDVDRISRALDAKAKAEAQIFALDYPAAITTARDGQNELLFVTPSRAVKPYADLAYVLGEALYNAGRVPEAKVAFAHSYRLDPSRVLDPTRVLPEIVQAFADARAVTPQEGTVEVPGTGSVWIDGTEVGLAPGTFPASEGEHVVWRTGIDRLTRGLRVAIAAGKLSLAQIEDREAPQRTKVQLARQLLARAPDSSARSAAMKRLADLVGVKDAVLLSMSNGVVIVQTWHEGPGDLAQGFSALTPKDKSTVDELLLPLAPPPKKIEPPFEGPKPIPYVKQWYERRPVQLGLAVGVAAVIVTGILFATRDLGSQSWNPDFGRADTGSTRR